VGLRLRLRRQRPPYGRATGQADELPASHVCLLPGAAITFCFGSKLDSNNTPGPASRGDQSYDDNQAISDEEYKVEKMAAESLDSHRTMICLVSNNSAAPTARCLSRPIQQQLDLKLESSKGPVEVLIIDRAERPTGN
jgi:hypothetical protein